MDYLQVLKVITACKRAGVSDFEYGELKLKFRSSEEPIVARDNQANREHNLAAEELRVRESDLDFLKLADPYEYEQKITQDELVHQESKVHHG